MELDEQLQLAVQDKYRIVRELTRGGMARVFLAKDVHLQRDVAIKVLSPDLVDPTMVERFRLEVLQTARLQHPTIIPLIEVGAFGDADRPMPFYVMPYARGESVRSRLSHEGPFTVGATVRLLRDVLGALEHAHGEGLVHRDIKPENIYLSGSHAMLADFGIAKAIAGKRGDNALTSPGETVGTPAYMAAEQMAGDPDADHRADIYSVGVVAYELLAGRLPWRGTTPSEKLSAQVRGVKEPLPKLRDDVPSELVDAIERCLAYQPADRPQSATEALHLLEGIPMRSLTPSSATMRIPVIPLPRSVDGSPEMAEPSAPVQASVASPRVQRLAMRGLAVVAAGIWIVANLSYTGMRAQNRPDASWRPVSFVLGFPGTVISFLMVREGGERAYGVDLPSRRP